MRATDKTAWQPTADQVQGLPEGIQVLLSPAGLNHIALDSQAGRWLRLYRDGTHEVISARDAMMLRPGDARLIIQMTAVCAIHHGPQDRATLRMIDDIAGAAADLMRFYATGGQHSG